MTGHPQPATRNPQPTAAERPWAVVTGASSGIGEALARELAGSGHDLVLVARDGGKLARLADALGREHGAAARVFARDLSDPAATREVGEALAREEVPVAVLVNNAGFGVHGPFARTDLGRELALVRVQVDTLLILTKACLPGMLRRRAGRILNVASVYAYSPVPQQAVYAATKAFMLSFSESLAAELGGTGVSVTVLCPGITATAFRARAGMGERPSRLSMTPEAVAAIGCRGLFRNEAVVVPGAANALYVTVSKLLPRRAFAAVTRRVNRRRGLGADS